MGRPWTEEELLTAKTMRRDGKRLREIGAALGRSLEQVGNKLNEKKRRIPKTAVAVDLMREAGTAVPPAEVLMERERRLEAPQTLMMILCGDPTFERSALGRRLTVNA